MIIYNSNYTHNPNAYLTIAIARAAEAVFGKDNVVVTDNRTIVELAAAGQHDTLLCIDGQRLNRAIMQRVRPAIRTMILWLFEDPFMLDYNQTNTEPFDYVFTNDPGCAEKYGEKGHYLPLAASEKLHFRPILADAELEYDVFFAGTMWPNRVNTIQELLRSFPNKVFKLVCPTNEYLPPLPREIAAHSVQWPISHESFVDFANLSRVTLTMFRNYASHGDVSQASAPGPRLFELGLAGTAQVAEIDHSGSLSNFQLVEGVACHYDTEALIGEVESILADPSLRRIRAEQAQLSTSENHLYECRLQDIARITGAGFAMMPVPERTTGGTKRKLRVLMCSHSTMYEAEWGGVEVYQQFLSKTLADEIEVFYWLRRNGTCTLMTAGGEVLDQFAVDEIGWLSNINDAAEEVAFAGIISRNDIDLVHFQHLGHHTASLPIIAKSCGVGTLLSVHDFFIVCSRYNLINYNSVFCDIGNRTITECDVCLKTAEGAVPGSQAVRRSFVSEMLRSVDALLFGTAYSEKLCLQIYPGLYNKQRFVMGIPTPADIKEAPPARELRSPGIPLRVAIVGNFLRTKGADSVLRVIETVDPSLFEFHIIGKAAPEYAAVFDHEKRVNVKYHGRYNAGELDALAMCDVAVFLSIWPETFCISLSESWQRGVVPIAARIGAFADRIEHGVNGYLVDMLDISAVIGYLELLGSDPVTLRTLRGNIDSSLWVDTEAYAEEILSIYQSVVPRKELGIAALGFDVGQLHLLTHQKWKDLSAPRHIFDPSRRSDIQLELPFNISSWIELPSQARIDSISGNSYGQLALGVFQRSHVVEVAGWAYVAAMGVPGQIAVVIANENGSDVIFLPTSREFRHDVSRVHEGAPNKCGFSAKATLRGKWSDGLYRVAIVNAFGHQAAFMMTDVRLTLQDGCVVNAEIHAAGAYGTKQVFLQVTQPISLRKRESLDFSRIVIATDRSLTHTFDDIGKTGELSANRNAFVPAPVFWLRGWACQSPAITEAGRLYVGLIGDGESAIFVEAERQLRPDVYSVVENAPQFAGFAVSLSVPSGVMGGVYRVLLSNVDELEAVVAVTTLTVTIQGRFFTAAALTEVDQPLIEKTVARLLPQAEDEVA